MPERTDRTFVAERSAAVVFVVQEYASFDNAVSVYRKNRVPTSMKKGRKETCLIWKCCLSVLHGGERTGQCDRNGTCLLISFNFKIDSITDILAGQDL